MHLENIVVDALEPQRLGGFWESALGSVRITDSPALVESRLDLGDAAWLDICLQRVPTPPREPLRLHLDLRGGDRQAEVVDRLRGLGATELDIGQGAVPWVVLADPEGNPFCVMEERPVHGDGPVAALPLDSADPDRDADLWSWLTGWEDADGVAPRSLRHPTGRGPLLEICPEPAPKGPGKNRMHLDVRLGPDEDPDEVAAGIAERGGHDLVHDWGALPWRTYVDGSGNEFCVLPAPRS